MEPEERFNVLVVEDDPALQETIVKILQHIDCDCDAASTCSEGRALFEEGRYATTVIDLGLPDGSGLDLIREFAAADPGTVQIVLTGESASDVIIDSMRARAFDYLTKPVNMTTLQTSMQRAISHFVLVRERAELFQLLMEERDQLRQRVEEATSDLRLKNARLQALLELTRLPTQYLTAEDLLRKVFAELSGHMPLYCMAICDVTRQKLLAVFSRDGGEAQFVRTEGDSAHIGFDSLLAEAEPKLLVQHWVERNTGLDTSGLQSFVFPHTSWNRSVCSVGFYLDATFWGDESEQEFLGMCSHFLAFEWDQSNLLLQVAHNASLGNIATELARNFIQPLTAIQTASEIISETAVNPNIQEGIRVITDNMNRLRRQTQEFRKLSLLREDSVETVHLDEYVNQALDMLSVAIQNRSVQIETDFVDNCECVLLNGTALARTFLDLLLGSLRAVGVGGTIELRLQPAGATHIAFEIIHSGVQSGFFGDQGRAVRSSQSNIESHPAIQLANRTVHTCGGKLTVDVSDQGVGTLRIVLPRNATDPTAKGGPVA